MISMGSINSLWAAIIPQKGRAIARRPDPEHPLDIFIGYDENEYMLLMIVAEHLTELPRSSKQVSVHGNQRCDGKYAICFSLSNATLKETFVSLCWDIITCTYDIVSEKLGVLQAVQRFASWQTLLAEELETKMSSSVVRKLLSELTVLYSKCLPNYCASHAVSGWVGPLRADCDFEYEDTWMKVKAVSPNREYVSISSFDELDIDRSGYLIICRIEETSDANKNATTLNSIISKIRKTINHDEQALSTLLVRLMLHGYRPDDECAEKPFAIQGLEFYLVEEDFPRIRRSVLKTAIIEGEYLLSIAAIQAHRTE